MFWNETCVLNGSEEKIAERFRPFYNVKIQEDYISGKLGAKSGKIGRKNGRFRENWAQKRENWAQI